MLYALCFMLYALCFMLYALCSMPYALCSLPYALCPMLYANLLYDFKHLFMNQTIGGEDLLTIEVKRFSKKVSHLSPCLGNDQTACSHIPGLKFHFPEPIEPACCQITEIDGSLSRSPNGQALDHELTEISQIEIGIFSDIIRKTRGEKTSV